MDRKFHATLIVKELEHTGFTYKGVDISLYRYVDHEKLEEYKKQYDFSKLIKNYDPEDIYSLRPIETILENFTIEEIDKMKSYFEKHNPADVFSYGEMEFPIESNLIGSAEAADITGNSTSFCNSPEELGFSVLGYYIIEEYHHQHKLPDIVLDPGNEIKLKVLKNTYAKYANFSMSVYEDEYYRTLTIRLY